MKKRRLTKSEKATVSKIQGMQLAALTRLKERTELLIRTSEDIVKTIEAKGIDNHYSLNSDVLRYASEVWSTSIRLGELKAMLNDLEYIYGDKK